MDRTVENLRIFREMQGYTQSYVAMKLGVSHTAYAKIERGETMLNQNKICIICEVLNIDTNTLKNFDKSIYFKSQNINK